MSNPSAGAAECDTTVSIVAQNIAFDIDSFEVPANTPFCIEFENKDTTSHNVAIYDGSEALFSGEFLTEPGTTTYQVPALPEGSYQFKCEAHPAQMVGDVTVTGS